MNQVFVLEGSAVYCHDGSSAITALAEIATLDDGSVAVFQENGVKVTDGGAFVKTDQYGTLYMGRGKAWAQKSNRINFNTLTYKKQVYVAPVAKILHVGYNGASGAYNHPATSKVGSYYGVAVIDLTKPVDQRRRFTIDLTTIVADIADAAITTAMVAAITAHPAVVEMGVTVAAEGTTGIKITGVAGKNFEFMGVGLLESATQTDDGNFVEGVNGYEWAAELEFNESTVEGRSSALESAPDDGFKLPARVIAAQSYTVYSLNWTWLREGYRSANGNAQEGEITLIVPAANSTIIASIDALLGNIYVGAAADANAAAAQANADAIAAAHP